MSRVNNLILTVIFLLLFCQPLDAQSNLAVSKEFKVVSVNGNAYAGSLSSKASLLKLAMGVNKIAISYGSDFKNTNGDIETIKSNIFIVSFYLPSEGHYRLLHLKQSNLKAAQKFVKKPIINIINQQGTNVKLKQFFPTSQTISLIHQNTKNKLKTQQPIRLVSNQSSDKKQQKVDIIKDAESMLLFWWQQATPQQRQSFLKKVESSN